MGLKSKIPMKQVTMSVPDLGQAWYQYKHWFLILVLIAAAFAGGFYVRDRMNLNPNIQRQIYGDLTPEEIELLKEKPDINQLKSQIRTERQLKEEAQRDLGFEVAKNKDLVKKYNLKVDSLTKVIANLKGSTDKGIFKFDSALDGTQSFVWKDEYSRFNLFIPDTKATRSYFTYDQHFKINIVAYKQQSYDGALRVQTVHLWETTADGKTVLGEAKIDLSKSTFDFTIEEQRDQPARKWLTGLSTRGELLVSWLPINKFHGMMGIGLSAGAGTQNTQFAGITVMGFPPGWYNSGFGVGASVGYSPQDKGKVSYRLQVAWSLRDLFSPKR
jgi:hypothetical protein